MANRAHQFPIISITVIEVFSDGCIYRLKAGDGREEKPFLAFLHEDFYTLKGMQNGKSYVVNQRVDNRGVTHWTCAQEIIDWNVNSQVIHKSEQANNLLQF